MNHATVCLLYVDEPPYGLVLYGVYATRGLARAEAMRYISQPHEWDGDTLTGLHSKAHIEEHAVRTRGGIYALR